VGVVFGHAVDGGRLGLLPTGRGVADVVDGFEAEGVGSGDKIVRFPGEENLSAIG